MSQSQNANGDLVASNEKPEEVKSRMPPFLRSISGNRKRTQATAKRSDRRAFKSALVLRSMIFGLSPSQSTDGAALNKAAVKKVKTDLLNPKLANRVIAELHALPPPSDDASTPTDDVPSPPVKRAKHLPIVPAVAPMHALCLDFTDEEAEKNLFSKLPKHASDQKPTATGDPGKEPAHTKGSTSVAQADISNMLSLLKDARVISFFESPDLGFGQPVEKGGIFSGSVPSAKTVSIGVMQISQQLLTLGYASSRAVFPNHAGVYPPLDRMSVITCMAICYINETTMLILRNDTDWWGLEVTLPPPSIKYLSTTTSVSHSVLNFLSAAALVNNGVREILPFVRYFSQLMDFEWSAIQAQDKGQGVVCAATWVMPAALVPRPWDFAPRPPSKSTTLKSKLKF